MHCTLEMVQPTFPQQQGSQGPASPNSNFSFTYKGHAELVEIMKLYIPQILSDKYINKYSKELSVQIFEFQVAQGSSRWTYCKLINTAIFTETTKHALFTQLRSKYKEEVPQIPVKAETDYPDQIGEFLQVFLNGLSTKKDISKDQKFLLFIECPCLPELSTSSYSLFFLNASQQAYHINIYIRQACEGREDILLESNICSLPTRKQLHSIYPSNRLSLIGKLKRFRQVFLEKSSGGRHNEYGCRKCTTLFRNWKTRFFTVTSEGVFYTESFEANKSQVKQMIIFSVNFSIEYGLKKTGYRLGITLYSCNRKLVLWARDHYDFILFVKSVKLAIHQNKYLVPKRYNSFADVRLNCGAAYFVDGQDYFKAVCDAFLNAKSEIFITDWMLSPEFILIRPSNLDSQFRLDRILLRKAKEGVKVYILVYKEPKMALNNDSQYTKQYLEGLHQNIKVMRHPNYMMIPFLWSHHQKTIVVDQKIGFLGGLDLCYGRLDNSSHSLKDPGFIITREKEKNSIVQEIVHFWSGIDYVNFRKRDIYQPRKFETSTIDRQVIPRLPWHDVGVKIVGDSVIDLARHFVQYWNFVNFQTNFDDRELLMQAGMGQKQSEQPEENKNHESKLKSPMTLIKKLSEPFVSYSLGASLKKEVEMIETTQQRPRQLSCIRDRERVYFQQNIQPPNFTKHPESIFHPQIQFANLRKTQHNQQHFAKEQMQFYNKSLPQQNSALKYFDRPSLKKLFFKQNQKEKNELVVEGRHSTQKGKQRHQILRSAASWSLGLQEGCEENSIYQCYIDLIARAEEFIYIENQFFICNQNKICEAIKFKIENAYVSKKSFKVMILMPLLPAFEGEIEQESSAVLRVQMSLEYETICRGGHSLLESLSYIPNIHDYIRFYSTRTHSRLNGTPVTEIVYIHTKLMIVDDKYVILGSANINDRSMLGTRDSEVAVIIIHLSYTLNQLEILIIKIVIEDTEQAKYKRLIGRENDGTEEQIITVSKSAHQLRMKLWTQHFGLSVEESQDPLNQRIWNLISQRANSNTLIYREVFACYPDDTVGTMDQLRTFSKSGRLDRYDQLHQKIRGNVVEFPLQFLNREDLSLRPSQVEYYVPSINFT